MARRTDVFNVANSDTVISSGVQLRGNLTSEGDVSIDGTLAGNIKSGGHVTIGVNGRIGGSIHAVSAQIAGKVDGNIVVEDSASLLESAQVVGDIKCSNLEVALGALFIGQSQMKPVHATEVSDRTNAEG